MLTLALAAMLSVPVMAQVKSKTKSTKQKVETTMYACPMKCEGAKTYTKAGKCPTCGMPLEQVKKQKKDAEAGNIYSCPMHPEVTSNKPVNCFKCGMALTKTSEQKKEMVAAKAYACPMKCEGDKTYAEAGKCPKCGMYLKEVKAKQ